MMRLSRLRPVGPKKTLSFPRWVEGLLIVAAIGMAVVEGTHGQWIWAGIFGVCGLGCGIGFGVRLVSGDKYGGT